MATLGDCRTLADFSQIDAFSENQAQPYDRYRSLRLPVSIDFLEPIENTCEVRYQRAFHADSTGWDPFWESFNIGS